MGRVRIRPANPDDAKGMADVLNPIIAAGGTTAIEVPVTNAEMAEVVATTISCHVAIDGSGGVLGTQWLDPSDEPGDLRGFISSFTRRCPRIPGIGRSLFAATTASAREAGLTALVAEIRADNVSGIGYYRAMGFYEYSVRQAVPLADGTPVDRLLWIYRL